MEIPGLFFQLFIFHEKSNNPPIKAECWPESLEEALVSVGTMTSPYTFGGGGCKKCTETGSKLISACTPQMLVIAWVTDSLWSRTTKNPEISMGPLTRLFAFSLALHCLLCCAFSFTHSLLSSWENECLDHYFCCVVFWSGPQCDCALSLHDSWISFQFPQMLLSLPSSQVHNGTSNGPYLLPEQMVVRHLRFRPRMRNRR